MRLFGAQIASISANLLNLHGQGANMMRNMSIIWGSWLCLQRCGGQLLGRAGLLAARPGSGGSVAMQRVHVVL